MVEQKGVLQVGYSIELTKIIQNKVYPLPLFSSYFKKAKRPYS